MIQLNTEITELKQVIHIADIHIRNVKRHKEYKELFKKLIAETKSLVKAEPNTIVYIGGDIAHTKTDMSPELIEMISYLFESLANITDVLVIAGNHDLNLNNKSRLDALTPIVNLINKFNKRLHYLKKSEIYRFADTDFAVFSLLDGKKIIPSSECSATNKIALYHGPIVKAVLDSGMVIDSGINLNVFDGYDIAMLGDLHKMQVLQEYHIGKNKVIKPAIKFVGSFCQNNFGESYENHGYYLWKLKTKKADFVKIPNDYGYYTLRLTEPKLPDNLMLSKHTQLRLQISKDFKKADLMKIKSELKTKFNITDIVLNTISDRLDINGEKVSGGDVIGNIYDVNYQNQLIKTYLDKTINFISDEDVQLIFDINRNLNSLIKQRELNNNSIYKLKYLKFSNLFSYGEDNYIDFTKISGITGIFSKNKTGKSSLISILLFMLSGKSLRTSKAIDILNKKKNHFHSELCFETNNGKEYFIRKLGKRSTGQDGKDSVKVLVDFWTLDDAGSPVSLNGDQRRSTDENIQDYVGTSENIILTAISLQNNFNGLIDKSQTERKQILSSFLGINIFEDLYFLGNEKSKELSILIKEFSKKNYDDELAQCEIKLTQQKKILDITTQKIQLLEEEKTQKTNNLIELSKELIKIEETKDLTDLKEQKKVINVELDTILTNSDELKIKLDRTLTVAKQLAEKFKKYNEVELTNEISKLEELEKQKETLSNSINDLNLDIKHQEEKLEKLNSLEYNPDCSYCMNNIFVKDAIQTKQIYADNLSVLKDLNKDIIKLDNNINKKLKFRTNLDKFEEIKKGKENLKILYNKLVLEQSILIEKQNFQNKLLSDVERDIEFYHKNQNAIETNKKTQKKINLIQNDLLILKNKLDSLNLQDKTCNSEIKLLQSQKDEILKTISKIHDYENEYRLYNFYLTAVHRNAIPYELIKQVIPIFEFEIKSVLRSVSDFEIAVECDLSHINFYIVYSDTYWSLELSCGMELFISSLAIRIALMRICNIPRLSALIIDEGWSALDSDNLIQLEHFFDFIKSQFDWVLAISHIQELKDFVDSTLSLELEHGYSKIVYD